MPSAIHPVLAGALALLPSCVHSTREVSNERFGNLQVLSFSRSKMNRQTATARWQELRDARSKKLLLRCKSFSNGPGRFAIAAKQTEGSAVLYVIDKQTCVMQKAATLTGHAFFQDNKKAQPWTKDGLRRGILSRHDKGQYALHMLDLRKSPPTLQRLVYVQPPAMLLERVMHWSKDESSLHYLQSSRLSTTRPSEHTVAVPRR